MAGITFPKVLALAAVGSVALVGVVADAAAPGMVQDHSDMDPSKHDADLTKNGYKAYWGMDYIPEDGKDAVTEDVGSAEADSAMACAEACEEIVGCNGASYYPDPVAYFGKEMKNCWLKIFTETCVAPTAAIEDPLAVLILKPAADCAAPEPVMGAPVVGAAAPMAAVASEGPVEAGTRDFTLTEDPTAGTVSMRSAAAALAVAGAILALA